mmetsp:Transcript_32272/g.47455  ORF Transcript_32272/g.47455 Transcript_32272/m.47455 type:complete len:102 (+) Transcript_32272:194-499(+)
MQMQKNIESLYVPNISETRLPAGARPISFFKQSISEWKDQQLINMCTWLKQNVLFIKECVCQQKLHDKTNTTGTRKYMTNPQAILVNIKTKNKRVHPKRKL